MDWVGDLSDVTLTNVTSYNLYINNVLQAQPLAFPISITQGDTVYIEVVPTSTASAAKIEFLVDGLGSVLKYDSLSYFYPRTTVWVENMTQVADNSLHTDQTYKGTGSNTALTPNTGGVPGTDYVTDTIFDTPVSGNFEMLIQPDRPGSGYNFYGLGDRTTRADNWYQRQYRTTYAWEIKDNDIRVRELSTLRFVGAILNATEAWYRIKGTVAAGVGTVTYHYSTDEGATWTLVYTSLITYAPALQLYAMQCHQYSDSTRFNRGIYNPPRLRIL
jgi:hypothetical protein